MAGMFLGTELWLWATIHKNKKLDVWLAKWGWKDQLHFNSKISKKYKRYIIYGDKMCEVGLWVIISKERCLENIYLTHGINIK